MQELIFWPVIALAGITAAVSVVLYRRRVSEIRTNSIHPQKLATRDSAAMALKDTRASDNFRNLFEVPVLFYIVCICLFVTESVTMIQLGLAWMYVLLRALHSYIHVTYNRVIHRFTAFIASSLFLLVIWILFGVSLAG